MKDFYTLRTEFTEIDKLLENVDPAKVKITGSYLWYPEWGDIDCATYDPAVVYRLKQNAIRHGIKIDIKVLSYENFDRLEDLMTFKNFCMAYYCGKIIKSKKFINSQYLEANPESVSIFNFSAGILEAYRKNLARGFLVRQNAANIQ